MSERAKRPRRKVRELLPDACFACGTTMREARGRLSLPINGEKVLAPATYLLCPRCGEIVLRAHEARRLDEDAIAIYRKRHGLLSADEMRAIRDRLGFNQAALARLLGLGANTISRWESGRNVQSVAMDILLRLVRDVPGSVAYLRKRAA